MSYRNSDSRLSRAASAIWRLRTAEPDPYDKIGRDNDCGPLIDAYYRRQELKAVEAAGFATAGQYNEALRRSLGVPEPDADGRTPMSYKTYQ